MAGTLTIFDIDDTLFRTSARVKVMHEEGEYEYRLSSIDHSTHELKKCEYYDFSEFSFF